MTDQRCDFCSSDFPSMVYDCRDFDVITVDSKTYRSTGPWLACDECVALIEAGQWERLVGWSIETIADRLGQDPVRLAALLADQLATTYETFRLRRLGPATIYTH